MRLFSLIILANEKLKLYVSDCHSSKGIILIVKSQHSCGVRNWEIGENKSQSLIPGSIWELIFDIEPGIGKKAEDTQAVVAHSSQAGGRRISGTWELNSWRQSVTGAGAGGETQSTSKNKHKHNIHHFKRLISLQI